MLRILKGVKEAADIEGVYHIFRRFHHCDDQNARLITRVMMQFHHIIEKNERLSEIALFNESAQNVHKLMEAKPFPFIIEKGDEAIEIFDLKRIIYDYLSTEDLKERAEELSTRAIVELLNEGKLNFKEIGCKDPSEAIIFIESLFSRYALRRVNLGCYRHTIRDHHVRILSYLTPEVEEFRTVSRNVTFRSFGYVRNLRLLGELELRICHFIKDLEISYLSELSVLHTLFLGNCQGVTNKGINRLAQLKNLKVLYLSQCTQVDAAGYSHLSTLPNIEQLHFSWCSNLNERALASFSELKQLHTISFWTCPDLTDDALTLLEGIPSLRKVRVLNCRRVTEENVHALIENLKTRDEKEEL
ncbi:MAG: hypothetical protein WD595_03300 [Waddliaceae bacterium]